MFNLLHASKNLLILPRICKKITRKKCLESLNLWNQDINTDIKLTIEKYWQQEVLKQIYEDSAKKHFYVLPMFPYPSGNLHMGHVRVYSISDTIARFQKLTGVHAIHPIGWDAFGLPAENAAIERNIAPNLWTQQNISSMKKQLQNLAFDFDWSREISTCDPNYYKWTQYIFLKLFERGLAYQNMAQVNWDPVDKTVLADEQVDELGYSWRSGAKVEKKYLTQWYIKTTKFAQTLYDGLDQDCLENWNDIINLQKHWIGECNGVVVSFSLLNQSKKESFDVWTPDPYKFIHGDFITMKSSHALFQKYINSSTSNLRAHNPVRNLNIPVYVCDDVEYPEGRDVYLGCSSVNQNDMNLAVSLGMLSHQSINNFNIENENSKALEIVLSEKVGGYFVNSKLKDWLVSRQRYWGTPIPIIHCRSCGTVPVPYEDLPVRLPTLDISCNSIQTLEKAQEWINCKCPKCAADAQRETDTMDTFVDSSWYYYRFLDPHNDEEPFNLEKVKNLTPVDIYIGGKEHAVLHLYYARFMSYFLHSLGWTPTAEPFRKLVVQGMVMGQSYKLKSTGKYLPAEQVQKSGKKYTEKSTGEPVVVQWEKMSKSKHNGVNPDSLLQTYGCDTTRLLILADVPPATTRKWSDATLPGVLNWQHRLWLTIREFLNHRNANALKNTLSQDEFKAYENKIKESRNYFIATATYHFKYTQKLSVGISRLQALTSTLRNKVPPEIIARSKEFELSLAALIIMLSPITPHFCSELWAGFRSAPNRLIDNKFCIDWEKNVTEQKWPTVDSDHRLSFQCKVDGADRCELKVKAADLPNINHDDALKMMLGQDDIKKWIKYDIIRTKYECYPDCRAILHIYTNRMHKPVTEIVEEIRNK